MKKFSRWVQELVRSSGLAGDWARLLSGPWHAKSGHASRLAASRHSLIVVFPDLRLLLLFLPVLRPSLPCSAVRVVQTGFFSRMILLTGVVLFSSSVLFSTIYPVRKRRRRF